jgi:hypothetical protein
MNAIASMGLIEVLYYYPSALTLFPEITSAFTGTAIGDTVYAGGSTVQHIFTND